MLAIAMPVMGFVPTIVPRSAPVRMQTIQVGGKQLAGDMGFDPLDLADTPESLAWYREAEVKHARLAMLAAFGWPVSEVTNFGKLLTNDGRAPSLLNGGLGEINGIYWGAVIALAVYWESKGLDKQYGKKDNYLPGMLGFDPLGKDSPAMREAEITNGRVAMIAITVFALEEALTKAPIFPISLFH
ncbi:protein fucoxanthin chlorophyll a c protein [Chrysochromulina tobinii]|uniref:Protein fucoxanthin chlorophyll a c protein n=1 Tax=Chrysochromulina tobinii TaxID=1460289 RepID=A0A0M0JNY7_9EUKA|nr:protein fucoxanthin chlorophyll a c protein [Chrysochromulina tobinii]|eukprot:KOO28002.1 protein fucoxanthin chlorophyll a c protein [Chrysochromulina sp. CCMP291]